MNDDMNDDTVGGRSRQRRVRSRRAGMLAAALAGIALLVAACGGGGGNSSVTAQSTTYNAALAYAKCMRSHGDTNFPDPDGQGGFSLPNGSKATRYQFQAADSACKHLSPNASQITAANQLQVENDELKMSVCMRSHGITNFPDPSVQNGQMGLWLPNGINPDSPQFQAAQKTCNELTGPGGGS